MNPLPPDTDLALDFVNTERLERSGRIDHLGSLEDVRAWLGDAVGARVPGAVDALRAPSTLRLVADEAHRLRRAARALLQARSNGTEPPPGALFELDRALTSARILTRVVSNGSAIEVRVRYECTAAIGVLAPVAHALARLLESVDPARLRACAAPGCPEWFIDTSRAGRRRWCSMERCGNRYKAARHRERHRT